ncbi:MAG: ATP-binding protein, partial [Zetaproteobacteria bacterium]|nr:ATP-binding protein [Zetaproteobacteria bacterium]
NLIGNANKFTKNGTLTLAADMAAGNFIQNIPVRSEDELGQLSRSMEKMGNEIHKQFETQVQLQENLKAEKKKAEAASEAKSRFVANMSHEIRTPLNGVIGMTDLLAESPLNEAQQHLMQNLKFSAQVLMELINNVLDFSKLEAEETVLVDEPISLQQYIHEIIKLFQSQCSQRGNKLHNEVSRQLPTTILGDSTRIRQILINLIGNANKFTKNGTLTLAVSKTTHPNTGQAYIQFAVQDTGIGFSEEAALTLFQAFKQAEKDTTYKYGGTGLGLSICHHLVTLMGGEIYAKSTPGKGSVFTFTLPLKEVINTQIDPSGQAAKMPFNLDISKLHILVVEDNRINQELAKGLLQLLGAQHIMLAENGKIALEKVTQQTFDVIFMDMRMPVMDGLTATHKIREWESAKSESEKPHFIVALTANVTDDDMHKCTQAGTDYFLCKPLKKQALIKSFQQYYHRRGDLNA